MVSDKDMARQLRRVLETMENLTTGPLPLNGKELE
jgi:hypothetical protein